MISPDWAFDKTEQNRVSGCSLPKETVLLIKGRSLFKKKKKKKKKRKIIVILITKKEKNNIF